MADSLRHPDQSPRVAWRGDKPLDLSLSEVLRGREIVHVEHEVDARWQGFLRLRLDGGGRPQLLLQPVQPEPGVDTGGLQWGLKFSTGRTPTIWTPKRSMLGDGPLAVRDLQRLVGKRFQGIATGARTQDGMAVARMDFEDGTAALCLPQPLPMALSLAVGCIVLLRVVFLEPIPDGPATPGLDLLS